MDLFRDKQNSIEPEESKRNLPFNLFNEFDFVILKAIQQNKVISAIELANQIGLSLLNSRSHVKKLVYFRFVKIDASSSWRFISLTEEGVNFLNSDLAFLMQDWIIKESKKRQGRKKQRFLMKRFLEQNGLLS